jgi:hypothetical protein
MLSQPNRHLCFLPKRIFLSPLLLRPSSRCRLDLPSSSLRALTVAPCTPANAGLLQRRPWRCPCCRWAETDGRAHPNVVGVAEAGAGVSQGGHCCCEPARGPDVVDSDRLVPRAGGCRAKGRACN